MVEFSDPTTAGQGYELVVQDAVQLQSHPMLVRRAIVRLGDATVVSHSTKVRIRTSSATHESVLAYVAFGPQTAGTVNGLPVHPGLLLAAEPKAPTLQRRP